MCAAAAVHAASRAVAVAAGAALGLPPPQYAPTVREGGEGRP
jgi:hypothetical protein